MVLFFLLQIGLIFADDAGSHHLGTIEIVGEESQSSLFEKVQTVTTLTGDTLLKKRANSLGETLKNEVGVTSTSYGPNTSRPVIRGMDGDRIRILQNGLGVLDASGASQDHAIPIDPLLMDRVEIVRGPLSLLYGSSAIGGVVNILTNRTHSQFEEGFQGAFDSQLSSIDNGKTAGFKTDYGTHRWMFHLDGNFRDTQNFKIRGEARSPQLQTQTPLPPSQEPRDKQPNSALKASSGGAGVTYVGDRTLIGISASHYDSDYGVLVEPDVKISLQQTRFDLVGEWKTLGFFNSIRLKSAQSIYRHREIELGEVGTVFKNNGNETRLEFLHNTIENWSGVWGLQSNVFNFSALGSEAFLPETRNNAQALFIFEEYRWLKSKFQIGARWESNRIQSFSDAKFTTPQELSFGLTSLSLGHQWTMAENWSLSTQASYSERAPNYQELFANGAHIATFSYQIGDTHISKEGVSSLEVSLRRKTHSQTSSLTLFGEKFNRYISLSPTGTFNDTDHSGIAGDSLEDLPIYRYLQQQAYLYGIELENTWNLSTDAIGAFNLSLRGDILYGKNPTAHKNLPRITPPRLFVVFEKTFSHFSSDLEFQQIFSQNNTAPNEQNTNGYFLANWDLIHKYTIGQKQYSFFFKANNIFNVEARNHVSVLKDYTQIGGRNISIGFRAYF